MTGWLHIPKRSFHIFYTTLFFFVVFYSLSVPKSQALCSPVKVYSCFDASKGVAFLGDENCVELPQNLFSDIEECQSMEKACGGLDQAACLDPDGNRYCSTPYVLNSSGTTCIYGTCGQQGGECLPSSCTVFGRDPVGPSGFGQLSCETTEMCCSRAVFSGLTFGSDCTANSQCETNYCSSSTKTCDKCFSDSYCDTGFFCDKSNGSCKSSEEYFTGNRTIPNNSSCQTSEDCYSGFCQFGRCSSCLTNSQCQSGSCIDGVCGGATGSSMCPNLYDHVNDRFFAQSCTCSDGTIISPDEECFRSAVR